jgi:hypothetical protein
MSVGGQEGQYIPAGSPLIHMRNLELESAAAESDAELRAGAARAVQASLRYSGFGAAEQERQRLSETNRTLVDKLSKLTVTSPISGVIVTPHVGDLVGSSIEEGQFLMELADASRVQARIYIPEFAMHEVRVGAPVRLRFLNRIKPFSGTLSSVSPTSSAIAEGLIAKEQLQGLNPPRYYLGVVLLENDGTLRDGMSGSAKIFVARRSLAGFSWRFARDIVNRKLW